MQNRSNLLLSLFQLFKCYKNNDIEELYETNEIVILIKSKLVA